MCVGPAVCNCSGLLTHLLTYLLTYFTAGIFLLYRFNKSSFNKVGFRGAAVERWSLTGELSLSSARPIHL